MPDDWWKREAATSSLVAFLDAEAERCELDAERSAKAARLLRLAAGPVVSGAADCRGHKAAGLNG